MNMTSITLLETGTINIVFDSDWYLEDISRLSEQIYANIPDSRAIETVTGADREYFRFEWQQQIYILQFECYGQSCWIEAEYEQGQKVIKQLCLQLSSHFNKI